MSVAGVAGRPGYQGLSCAFAVKHAPDWRHFRAGLITLLVGLGVACALMLPFRSHLSVATSAIVLIVPVVAAVVVGGAQVGLLATLIGFLVLDVVFIPPYWSLTVGTAENWVSLVVYVAVVLIVGRVVSRLQLLREESARDAVELAKTACAVRATGRRQAPSRDARTRRLERPKRIRRRDRGNPAAFSQDWLSGGRRVGRARARR